MGAPASDDPQAWKLTPKPCSPFCTAYLLAEPVRNDTHRILFFKKSVYFGIGVIFLPNSGIGLFLRSTHPFLHIRSI